MRAIALGLIACLAACGGGGGSSSVTTPSALTLIVLSSGSIDGLVLSDGTVSSDGFFLPGQVGDRDDIAPGVLARQFLHFDLTGLPTGASVLSAVLLLPQVFTDGDPYASLGSVVLDHVNFGPALDPADFAAPALASDVAVLSTDALLELKIVDTLGPRVAADVAAGRSASQFRLRFSGSSAPNGLQDTAQFLNGEHAGAPPAVTPGLLITYLP